MKVEAVLSTGQTELRLIAESDAEMALLAALPSHNAKVRKESDYSMLQIYTQEPPVYMFRVLLDDSPQQPEVAAE